IEVPSSVAGQVKDVRVKAGDKVKVGQAILSVDDADAGKAPEKASAEKGAPEKAAPATPSAPAKKEEKKEEEPHAEGAKGEAKREPSGERSAKASRSGETNKVVDISRGARAAEPAAESEFPP